MQAFRDSYRDARDTRGKVAADFWLAVVGDAVISLAREYDVVIRETGKRLKYRALAIASGVLLSGSVFVYVIECVR
ncbi:MAG: hypothetical protein ACRDIY_11390 [Chloroflexota bacterium]